MELRTIAYGVAIGAGIFNLGILLAIYQSKYLKTWHLKQNNDKILVTELQKEILIYSHLVSFIVLFIAQSLKKLTDSYIYGFTQGTRIILVLILLGQSILATGFKFNSDKNCLFSI